MTALKRLAASTLLGLSLAMGAATSAAAQCFDVYEWVGAIETREMRVDFYEYAYTICFV